MASFSALDILKIAPRKPIEELFDGLWMPHWSNYLSPSDVENLRRIATSKKYAGNMDLKYRMIDNIMKSRGFRRFAGGTNRLVFAHYEDPSILAKVAIDKVGMTDNPYEYKAQVLIKPYCTKMLQVTDCGTVGFAERVLPITSVKEFKLVADDVLDIIMNKIIGRYIMEDIGSEFYMNWGIRRGFGPVLLDYPYVFETEGAKLYCQNLLPNGMICNHEIDYDAGFNKLVCLGCGKIYTASDLKKDRAMNNIIIRKGGSRPMNVKIVRGDKVITQNYSSDTIRKPDKRTTPRKVVADTRMKVSIVRGDEVITMLRDGQVLDKEALSEIEKEESGYVQTNAVLDTEEEVQGSSQAQPDTAEREDTTSSGIHCMSGEYAEQAEHDVPPVQRENIGGTSSTDETNIRHVSQSTKEEERVHSEESTDRVVADSGAKEGSVNTEDVKTEERDAIRSQIFTGDASKYGLRSNSKRIPIGSPFIDSAGDY